MLSTPNKRLKFFEWLTTKGVVIDDIEKMEATIREYQTYLDQKAFEERLEKRNEAYIKDIKKHEMASKEEDWWTTQQGESTPPGPPDEGEYTVPWYYDGEYHER